MAKTTGRAQMGPMAATTRLRTAWIGRGCEAGRHAGNFKKDLVRRRHKPASEPWSYGRSLIPQKELR